MDFCKTYNWEIVDDTLFFLSNESIPSLELVDQFINEIRPAVDTGKKPKRGGYDLPYVTKQPLKIDCPICAMRLQPGQKWLACPQGDGILVTGEQLLVLRQNADPTVLAQALQSHSAVSDRTLICPYCKAPMKQQIYQNTNLRVDICTSCRYRWLDYNEVDEIAGIEQSITAQ